MNDFRRDLKKLTATITKDCPVNPDSKLGDVVQYLGAHGLLLQRKKDDNFDIKVVLEVSDETRDYLNALQTEKFEHCRLCYHRNDQTRCDFHKKYIFTKNEKENYEEYIEFLNSEMGIISFIELYYTYLSLEFWKANAQILLRDLTGFSSLKELLTYYGHNVADDVDQANIQSMDVGDEDEG
ncbi:ac34-like protein [Cryptophlebia peltastica nucleopolyhedrovirus]|uniref:Ac34-like protein n=1 Tax=Cryptophlebia peltastica nucleopolyhedrovirus TaxID=2304025 RepID=A0A346RNP3_9ABAC|nr:ac34-like protein [Cryptophlebia peltastica nucleopolyhedrovirus]AXS67690.1 ac34-like protein [Cryptophlebia peltastica nucleopolyhedrovirus]